ncbi:GumC family protein [Arcticibacter eurypsychrophilus]|uniref:GumC family protein n=1 Tax=Arcticibacter eurypsychrophilus TaxID=1434752 RepID=UPI00084D083E|nr:polysaccharide biosynthesis tyrosine autokinase [Arcticibacter eurypsychrophilus]
MSFDENEETNYSQLWKKMKAAWPWFLLAFIVFFTAVFFYVMYTTPMYNIHALIKINNSNRGAPSTSTDNSLSTEFGVATASIVDEEAVVLQTKYLMERVVNDMKLNITYFSKGPIRDEELYTPPFTVQISEPVDTIRFTHFDAEVLGDKKIHLENDVLDTIIDFNQSLKLDHIGRIKLVNPQPGLKPEQYAFTLSSVDQAVNRLSGNLTVALLAKQMGIIDLNLVYPVPKKGEDILNKLLDIYVQSNLEDRNTLADSSVKFIQNRLSYLGGELGDLEGNIQNFKQRNQIAEMGEQSRVMVQNTSQFSDEVAKVETQISVLSSLQDYLQKNAGNDRIVPGSLVVSDPTFSSLVDKYNTLLLERDRRMVGVTAENPVITNINERIANLRADMLSSLSSSRNSLNITRNSLQKQVQTVAGKVQGVPEIERNYLDLARQQQIKQQLYIFLMQKSEEAAIGKTYNTPNSKKIDPPKTQEKISPKVPVYYSIAALLALILPSTVIYTGFLLNSLIERKDDIVKGTQVPVIGEIGHNSGSDNLIVAHNPRSPIAEQFRALRTRLFFYLKAADEKVILLTSSMANEGKSFTSINLGSVLAISGKKVLLMELDLRKSGLSSKLGVDNSVGFTNYIMDDKMIPEQIIRPSGVLDNLFVISSGETQPNPAELLMNSRIAVLFKDLKERFDYIIVDAPPVGVVIDAQLLAEYADLCLYLVRQRVTSKSQLSIVEDLLKENEMKRLAIVMNDIRMGPGTDYAYGNYNYGDERAGLGAKIKSLFSKN